MCVVKVTVKGVLNEWHPLMIFIRNGEMDAWNSLVLRAHMTDLLGPRRLDKKLKNTNVHASQ